jgi:NAD(P)-dependent dehydrogenase (short-subunit alcohol dehydrogenase family)
VNAGAELDGRVCLVTGGARGIGSAIAEALAIAGARVAIVDLAPSGEEVADRIARSGGEAIFVCADVSSVEGAELAVEETLRAFGRLDSLVNNAGILRLADSFEDTPDDQVDDMLRVNFLSVFRTSRAALPALASSVNIASMVGHRIGMPSHAVYGASKAAVVGLSMTMAIELAPRSVRVNCVAPGVVATDLYVEQFLKSNPREALDAGSERTLAAIPIGSYASPQQIADVVGFLVGGRSDYVTGQTILVDGGYTGI